MATMRRHSNRSQPSGFTLIEVVVVIAVVGIIAVAAVPRLGDFLAGGKERAYETDRLRIEAAVRAFYGAQNNVRFLGKRQYPLLGRDQTDGGTLTVQTTPLSSIADDGSAFDAVSPSIPAALWNPLGGTQGADLTGTWTDVDGDGVRTIGGADTWSGVPVTLTGATYYTDPRYYAIDFEELVRRKHLTSVPESASPDNKAPGSTQSYEGSYIWYVDADGSVRSLYRFDPRVTGYVEGVFP